MTRKAFVRCINCRRRSSAVVEGGRYILPTGTDSCRCGCAAVVEIRGLLPRRTERTRRDRTDRAEPTPHLGPRLVEQ